MKKRTDGRWQKQVFLGYRGTGKRDSEGNLVQKKAYKTVYGKTKKEVEIKAYELLDQIGKGINVSLADDSFGKWMQRFLEFKKTENLSTSHIQTLELFAKHLRSIDNIPIKNIETQHLTSIIIDKASDKLDTNGAIVTKALSKRTLKGIKQCAKQVFNMAIESRVINYNPASYVRIPKNANETKRAPILPQQQKWITNFEHRAKRAAMIMLYAGLRRGEVTALTWADINFREGFISVTKSAEFLNGQPHIKSTKTESGIRTVDIPQILIDYLWAEKEKDSCMYVLHTTNGEMFTISCWRRMWDSYMVDLNIEYGYTPNQRILMGIPMDKELHKCTPGGIKMVIDTFTPHQLRHTFATNCYHADVPVEVCRDWMGHSNIQTTLDIYTHLSKTYKREKKSKLDEYYAKQSLA